MKTPLRRNIATLLGFGGLITLTAANPLGGLEQHMGAFLLVLLLAAVIYEVLVTLIEALVYQLMLKVRYRTVLGFSAIANLASLITGFVPVGGDFLGRFLVAIVVETPIMMLLMRTRVKCGETTFQKVALASLCANLVTHGLTRIVLLV